MLTSLCKAAFGLMAVIDPSDGDGWHETLLAVLFIVGAFTLMFLERDVPDWVVGIMGLVAGYFFGAKITKHTTD